VGHSLVRLFYPNDTRTNPTKLRQSRTRSLGAKTLWCFRVHEVALRSLCSDSTHIRDVLNPSYNFNSGPSNNGNVASIANSFTDGRSQSFAYGTSAMVRRITPKMCRYLWISGPLAFGSKWGIQI